VLCPICFNTRRLDPEQLTPDTRLAGATPLWEWIGDEPATVFSSKCIRSSRKSAGARALRHD
jgi:hypothetical protein